MGIDFNKPLSPLPLLEFLSLGTSYTHPLVHPLPLLKYLSVSMDFTHPIPPLPSLIHLELHCRKYDHILLDIHLPSLTHINFTNYFSSPIPHLPSSITHLFFTTNSHKFPLPSFPPLLTHLYLLCLYSHPLPLFPPFINYIVKLVCNSKQQSFNAQQLPGRVQIENTRGKIYQYSLETGLLNELLLLYKFY